jgi:hypothetical protein
MVKTYNTHPRGYLDVLTCLPAGASVGGELPFGLVSSWPGDTPGVEARADGLAHFVAGQAGAHGPQEEFVIVERVHAITGERIARWALGVEN